MSERLLSPEKCADKQAIGAAACAACFADCPLARLARQPEQTTANVQAGNKEAATRALLDDSVNIIRADFDGGYASVESPVADMFHTVDLNQKRQEAEARHKKRQEKAAAEAKAQRDKVATARAAAQKAADMAKIQQQQAVARQKAVTSMNQQRQTKQNQAPAKRTLFEQFGHDLAVMFSVR